MTHPLLTPRYMVEADYPNSPFRVGDVLELSDTTTLNGQTVYYKKYPPIHLEVDMLKDYPHIFRQMHWSEGRELSEMPRWVKLLQNNEVRQVIEYKQTRLMLEVVCTLNEPFGHYDREFFLIKQLTPATEAEYLEYLKSKEK